MTLVSGSNYGQVEACPASAALPAVEEPPGPAAQRGTAVHQFLEDVSPASGRSIEEALAAIVDDDYRRLCEAIDLSVIPKNTVPEVALSYDVATMRGRYLGSRMRRDYVGLSASEIPLTLDALGLPDPDTVYVGDYKTGWIGEAKQSKQLMIGALAACRTYRRERAIIELIRIKPDGTPFRSRAELDAVDIDDMAFRVQDTMMAVVRMREVVRAGLMPDVKEGEHCRYCRCWSSCPAKASALVRVARGNDLDPLMSLMPLTPEMAGHAWVRIQEAKRVMHRLEAACHGALAQYGEIPLPDGSILRRTVGPGNEQLDGRTTFAVVRKNLGAEVAEVAVDIRASKAGIDRALAYATEAGMIKPRSKSAMKEQLLNGIRQSGGASRPERARIEVIAPASEKSVEPADSIWYEAEQEDQS